MKKRKQIHHNQKHDRTQLFVFLTILAALFAVPIIILFALNFSDSNTNPNTEKVVSNNESESTVSELFESSTDPAPAVSIDPIVFPVLLGNSQLEIVRTFLFDGLNPDCNNTQGSNITALEVRNLSAEHLKNAVITLGSSDGKEMHFVIQELPAEKSVMVFSVENAASTADTTFGNAECELIFNTNASMYPEELSISTEGTQITVRNNTDAIINEIVLYCHSVLEDQYLGGITYNYTIDNLSAYETVMLDAVDCILGVAEVVRVEINNS